MGNKKKKNEKKKKPKGKKKRPMAIRKSLTSRFLRYIKIPSVSKDEKAFGHQIKSELREFSSNIFEDDAGKKIGGNCGNIYSFVKGSIRGAPTILFNAHLDTVKTKPIKYIIRKDKIFSDGSTILGADDKVGVAVIMELLAVLKEKKIRHSDILVIFTVAEEIGLFGTKNLKKSKLKADFGIAVDGGKVSTAFNAAPSQDSFTAVVHGEAAHAGIHPEKGINAIKIASDAISRMKIGRIDEETTSNIGVISGGIATNIIPDRVEIKGEARSHNPNKLKKQINGMIFELKHACKKHGGRLEISVEHVYKSFFVSPMQILDKAAAKSGFRLKYDKTGGGSDANIFNEFGVPTVILGVGARGAHTKKEHVSISSMEKALNFFIKIVGEAGCEKRNIG